MKAIISAMALMAVIAQHTVSAHTTHGVDEATAVTIVHEAVPQLTAKDSGYEVVWNTLYLSQRLSGISNEDDQREMLMAITSGSLLTWQHVNLQGEYDFRKVAANDEPFDMKKIMALKLT